MGVRQETERVGGGIECMPTIGVTMPRMCR